MVRKEVGIVLLFLFFQVSFLSAQSSGKQEKDIPQSFCVSESEWKLYRMINEYRRQYDLPAVSLSKSLSYVATTHVKDLYFNHPDEEPCNAHSWSDKGYWKSFCYPKDEDKMNSVWDKPKEISNYPGKGYEIVYWENNPVIIDSVFMFWKSFDYFNSFLTNSGRWEGKSWNAIGIGIVENYAVAWFGEVQDPAGVPVVCGQEPIKEPTVIVEKNIPKPVVQQQDTIQLVSGKSTDNELKKTGTYFVIVRSMLPRKEAEAVLKNLKAKGYQDARLVITNGKIRVSINESRDKEEATRLWREAKKSYKDAWLFKY